MPTYSKCKSCAEIKPVEDFHRLRIQNGRRVYNPECKTCVNKGTSKLPAKQKAIEKGLNKTKKPCPECGKTKAADSFGYRMQGDNVYCHSSCIQCRNEKQKQVRKNPVNRLYDGAKSRAGKLGIPFNIAKGDIVVPELCPVFGIPLLVEGGRRTDNSPSVDRIDPSKGYVKGNICVISWKANRLKSNMSKEEIKSLLAYVSLDTVNSNT